MKIARNTKVLCFIMVIALALFGLSFSAIKTTYADGVTSNDYFSITKKDGSTTSETLLEDNNLVLKMGNDYVASFKRDLVVSDFEICFSMSSDINELYLTLKYDSFDVNGFLDKTKDTLNKNVENVISVKKDNSNYKVSVYGVTKNITISNQLVVRVNYTQGNLEINVNDNSFTATSEYKPKAFGSNVVGSLSIKTNCEETATPSIKIASIDQKTSANGEYKQNFELNEESKIKTVAKSVILANDSFYTMSDNDVVVKNLGEKTSISFKEYSVLKSSKSSSDFEIKIDDKYKNDFWFNNGSTKYFAVHSEDVVNFNVVVGEDVYATFKIKGIVDESAPIYNKDASIESFKKALYKATRAEYEVVDETTGITVTKEFYIRLGSSNYLEIPSMESFVTDDTCSYENLSYTVYYRNENSDWTSTSSFKIPLASVGKYEFYVLFKDKEKNTMEKSLFFDDDENVLADMKDYIFDFTVYNDAPISIKVGSQEKAYKGIEYSATDFTILAKDYEVKYTLSYCKTNSTDEKDWTAIPALTDLDTEDKNYDELKSYKYNGSLTFTPAKIGYYKIVASLFEKESTRSDEAEVVIEVNSTPKVVKPQSEWAKNNVWSIVFLSIGGLALVGIIVLLCIPEKKKDETK